MATVHMGSTRTCGVNHGRHAVSIFISGLLVVAVCNYSAVDNLHSDCARDSVADCSYTAFGLKFRLCILLVHASSSVFFCAMTSEVRFL